MSAIVGRIVNHPPKDEFGGCPHRPSDYNYCLDPDLPSLEKSELERRVFGSEAGLRFLRDWGYREGDTITWDHLGSSVPAEVMLSVLSFGECVRVWFDSFVCSPIGDYMDKTQELLRKVKSSHWRYGYNDNYGHIVRHLMALQALKTDLPDFEFRLTWSSYYNEFGPAIHATRKNEERDLYLDATFGLLLYYKGAHVLTIGFALTQHGVLVAQVQLREKHGNRFLYKLGMHYLDFALDILAKGFPGEPLYLVTGDCAPAAIRRAYGKEPCKMTPETERRITEFYNRELIHFDRNPSTTEHRYGRDFVLLTPKV